MAHQRLAQGDTALLAPDDTTLEHEPVFIDLQNNRQPSRWWAIKTSRAVGILVIHLTVSGKLFGRFQEQLVNLYDSNHLN